MNRQRHPIQPLVRRRIAKMSFRGRVRARVWLWKLKTRIATDRLARALFGGAE